MKTATAAGKTQAEDKETIFKRAAENGCRIVGVKEGSRVVIICDGENAGIAEAFRKAAAGVAGEGNVLVIDLSDEQRFGRRPFRAHTLPLELESRIADFKPTASFYIAASLEGEDRFRSQLVGKLLLEKLRTSHGHSPGMTEEIMEEGMLTDHAEVVRVTEALHGILKGARELKITSPAGTDLRVALSEKMKWVPAHSVTPGKWENLPIGEIFTCPESVEGKLVIDGVLGSHFDVKYGQLEKTPVTVEIRDSRAVSVACPNEELAKELRVYLAQEKDADRVGEIGIGTNVGLRRFIGNMLQDEKRPGVHIAFGYPYPGETGADWGEEVSSHIDGCLGSCTVDVLMRDGGAVRILENGELTKAVLEPTPSLPAAMA